MSKPDNIRFYIYQNHFRPAKMKGQNKVIIRAGDIHSEMGLKSDIPAVCSAMKTRIDQLYDVEILDIIPKTGNSTGLTVKYDLRNLYMEETASAKKESTTAPKKEKTGTAAENGYLVLRELEEKLRLFVSDRVEARFGKEWWRGTDMSFLADRWNERRIMNDRTNTAKKRNIHEALINYASFSDYRRIINNPFAWEAFEEYFPDRGWIIQRLKELDPVRNAVMHHTALEEDDFIRLNLYSRDIFKIIDKWENEKTTGKSKKASRSNKSGK
ncbi:Swt1 family HEPN domain-containing protein [Methanolapillus ohkumae]